MNETTMTDALAILRSGDELAMQALDMPWPKTQEELDLIVSTVAERQHDYGTCVYAMSIAAEATFHYIAHKLGVTGFQASCADMDILRRTRRLEHGFRLLNYDQLLYPQYQRDFDKLGWWPLIHANAKTLREAAKKNLEKSPDAHPNVRRHWEAIAALQENAS